MAKCGAAPWPRGSSASEASLGARNLGSARRSSRSSARRSAGFQAPRGPSGALRHPRDRLAGRLGGRLRSPSA
eukprot:14514548-Alexandrium_andersonii.AAC.1